MLCVCVVSITFTGDTQSVLRYLGTGLVELDSRQYACGACTTAPAGDGPAARAPAAAAAAPAAEPGAGTAPITRAAPPAGAAAVPVRPRQQPAAFHAGSPFTSPNPTSPYLTPLKPIQTSWPHTIMPDNLSDPCIYGNSV